MVRRLPAVLLLAATVTGQSQLVLPSSHAASEGTTSTNVPFGRSTPTRVQAVYDALLFGGASTITSVAFRLDGDGTAAPKQVDCEIRMSTNPHALVDLAPDFAGNRGTDEVVVLPRQLLTLPEMLTVATPSPFLPAIPLAVPFAYNPAAGPLTIEIVVFGQPPGAYSLDATYVCDSPEVPIGPGACTPAVGAPLRIESATAQVLWGHPWLARVLDAPPGAIVLMILGSTDTGPWNGLNLPIDLGPAGAAGCFLSIDIALLAGQQALGDGSATFGFAVPNQPSLVGFWVRFQGAALAAQLNLLGVITSQAKRVQICGFEPVGRLWSNGITATTGVRELGTAPVVRLGLQ